MGRLAEKHAHKMRWPEVGRQYLKSFERAVAGRASPPRTHIGRPVAEFVGRLQLKDLRVDHLVTLSDDTGVIQHATFTVPNRLEGYCLDDNARALLFSLCYEAYSPMAATMSRLQSHYLSFVLSAFNAETGRFRNFMSYGRQWLEDAGSEDSHGRAMWSLGATSGRCLDVNRRAAASSVFRVGLPGLMSTGSPRTWAYGILGCYEYLATEPDSASVLDALRELSRRLQDCLHDNRTSGWEWFEQSLSYANARLPQALLLSGVALGERSLQDDGLDTLRWLATMQTGDEGMFVPVATPGLRRGQPHRPLYDQQPIEACASVSAYLSAYRVTGDFCWMAGAQRAFAWFYGENILGKPLLDPLTGGCSDGFHPGRVNQNQGAESTISFLTSYAEMCGVTDCVREPIASQGLV